MEARFHHSFMQPLCWWSYL